MDHASQWLSPKNDCLSIFSVSPSLCFDAMKTTNSLFVTLEIRDLFKSRNTRLKSFATVQSQFAPCIICANAPVSFWKTNDNNNRSTERQIGKL